MGPPGWAGAAFAPLSLTGGSPALVRFLPGNHVESLHLVVQNYFHLAPRLVGAGGEGVTTYTLEENNLTYPALTSLGPSLAGRCVGPPASSSWRSCPCRT